MTKVQILHQLAEGHGYRRYLEVCTPTTGTCYGSIGQSRFAACHRLMYRCPPDFEDGLVIDFRSETDDITGCLAEVRRRGLRFDLALVDPWHTYATSHRDIVQVFALLDRGGAMVVHDCLPPTAALARPEFEPGPWCGLTYQAYVDFVTSRQDLAFYTVDTDFGCGVIRKLDERPGPGRRRQPASPRGHRRAPAGVDDTLGSRWRGLDGDHQAKYRFLDAHRHALLRLVTVEEFRRRSDPSPP